MCFLFVFFFTFFCIDSCTHLKTNITCNCCKCILGENVFIITSKIDIQTVKWLLIKPRTRVGKSSAITDFECTTLDSISFLNCFPSVMNVRIHVLSRLNCWYIHFLEEEMFCVLLKKYGAQFYTENMCKITLEESL